MNAITHIDMPALEQPALLQGFTLQSTPQSDRLLELRLSKETVDAFVAAVAQWPVQALEYKSFLRFQVGKILDDICQGTLRPVIVNTLLDRSTGGLLVVPEGLDTVAQAEDMVKLSTAVAHLLGRSNFDAMSGQFYARFVVENIDNSDSYLRQPHRVMELHNDGTFVNQITDYVLMMKIDEQNMEGGNSLLQHLDDWADLDTYYKHPLARRVMRWTAPPSKNTREDVFHAVFDTDSVGRPTMRYIDQFVQPDNFEEGTWLFQLGESLENSASKVSIPVAVGSFLLINNLFWLHGRDRFVAHPGLRRELMRQRGYISFPKMQHHRGQTSN
ncbi:glutarate dioxygenase GlaH [Pseudomonas plecoglossicida]|uniref:Glutarate 2-hydroxylase n=1 Tax=Pseudomonas plecoglossicida TaxID=70775 RepID=A0AAD0QUG8_PSEDL|nr:glutarate dioxygenase GlaH [Pseudomonas plecoglossicida]AXM94532.1 carbon starvation induced protein CsiD [Pseudomonas plecoglossicida]EPB93886.1 carbon starvation induced protein [Pseudomonas plecoglossicida NB2011]QLB55266.1 carbon starvation induced protein CsiD [Pseudomonas plecoglossicida]GLR35084.1 protein CsiD [Pseudomonas plecoglossicida]